MKIVSITVVSVVSLLVCASCSSNSTTEQAQDQELMAASSLTRPSKCCTDYPYQLTIAVRGLFNSFNKVATKTDVKNCHPKVTSVTSAMSAEYLGNGTLTGMASYGAFYQDTNPNPNNLSDGNDRFRVTWASAANNNLGYNYYGVCIPKQITYPDSLGQNHVYWAKLIPISKYKAYVKANPTKKDQTYTLEGHPVEDMSAIANVFIEPKGGYMATQEKAAYDSRYSSKGVVAVVQLKNNKLLSCYVVNNYDSGWLMWKEHNTCAGL